MEPNPLPRRIHISGDVAYFHCQISFPTDEDEFVARDRMVQSPEMQIEIDRAAREILGKEFRIRSIAVGGGSIELFIVLAAVGSFYMGFSRYKNFVESAELLSSQIQNILRRFMPSSASIATTWIPSATLPDAALPTTPSALQWYTSHQMQMILIYYFIASHAAMLIILFWLLIKKLS